MIKRVMVGVVGVPALVFLLGFCSSRMTLLLCVLLCGVGAGEISRAVSGKAGRKLSSLTFITAAAVPAVLYENWVYAGVLLFAFLTLVFLTAILDYKSPERLKFSDLTAAFFAGLIFPAMLGCLVLLRLEDMGNWLVFLPLGISFGSDTFALFAGMLFGKHKLTPVSPKKTVEGAVGGLFGGVLGISLVNGIALWATGSVLLPWLLCLGLGLTGSAVSQVGDLSFSVIKREFGVKDYGNLIPGHGGVLDRFDSVTFVTPFVYLTLKLI